MTERSLLNIHRKQLHDALVQRGIDPAVTRWTHDTKKWTHGAVDTLEAGLCFFLFSPDTDGTFNIYFRPGTDGGAPASAIDVQWQNALNIFHMWAVKIKAELEQDDPWQQYTAYLPPERLGDSSDNSPFTHSQAEHVVKSLELFHQRIQQTLPNYAEVTKQFDPQFDRLKEQAKKGAGRIDWSNQFVGMLIGLCMALSLAPDDASSLWQSWLQLIDGLLLP